MINIRNIKCDTYHNAYIYIYAYLKRMVKIFIYNKYKKFSYLEFFIIYIYTHSSYEVSRLSPK